MKRIPQSGTKKTFIQIITHNIGQEHKVKFWLLKLRVIPWLEVRIF